MNDALSVATAIPDQPATVGTAFALCVPGEHVQRRGHRRHGELHGHESRRRDAAHGLSFAADTRTFSGTPQAADVGTVSVKVTASDGNASGSDASAAISALW